LGTDILLWCLLQLSIGKQWKELLGYNDTIGFIVHVLFLKHLFFLLNYIGMCYCVTCPKCFSGGCKDSWSWC